MKRVLVLLPLIALVMGGCAPKTTEPTSGPEPTVPTSKTGDSLSGKLTLWTIWNAEPRKSALNEIVVGFEKANPGVKVEISNVEPDAYKTKIKVALGGADTPDIYFVWSGEKMLHSFVRGGNCLDLTPYLDADGGEWRQRIVPASLQPYVYDNKTWGVPYLLQCTFMFYNKDLLAKNGVEVPKTWDDLIAACKKLKAAGVTPIALGNLKKWPAHHYACCLFQRLMGQDAVMAQYDPMGPGDYKDPGWVKSLQMFDDFQKQGFFNPSPNGVDRDDSRVLFYTEKAAMFYTGTWDFSQFSEGGPAPSAFWSKWDFVNFPAVTGGKGEQDALEGSPDGYVVSSKTKNPELAVAFLKYMTSVEVAKAFAGKCKELVQVKGAVDESTASWYLKKYAELVNNAKVISAWSDTAMELSVADVLLDGVQALLAGEKTPDQIMQDVRKRQAEVKKDLQAAGVK
jgi:raffinose/stachyose/melibiose transport system substrate-binding protein